MVSYHFLFPFITVSIFPKIDMFSLMKICFLIIDNAILITLSQVIKKRGCHCTNAMQVT